MTAPNKNELESFHEFLTEQLQNGNAKHSLEEVLALWRGRQETIASIQRGLDELEAGRVKSAEEVLAKLGNRQEV